MQKVIEKATLLRVALFAKGLEYKNYQLNNSFANMTNAQTCAG